MEGRPPGILDQDVEDLIPHGRPLAVSQRLSGLCRRIPVKIVLAPGGRKRPLKTPPAMLGGYLIALPRWRHSRAALCPPPESTLPRFPVPVRTVRPSGPKIAA